MLNATILIVACAATSLAAADQRRALRFLTDAALAPDAFDVAPELLNRLMANRNDKPPKTLTYFDQAIATALRSRTQPMPEGEAYGPRRRAGYGHRTFINSARNYIRKAGSN